MNLIKKHLIEVAYQELSEHRVEKFTLTKLAKLADVSRNTIYNNFVCLDYIYKGILEEIIVKEISEGCNSSDELLINIVEYISKHRVLCMNLYYHTMVILKVSDIIRFINNWFSSYDENQLSENKYMSGCFIIILRDWFDSDLKADDKAIVAELLDYNKILKRVG